MFGTTSWWVPDVQTCNSVAVCVCVCVWTDPGSQEGLLEQLNQQLVS